MKTYICYKQRTPDNVQISKRKKFSKLDSHPELRIFSELSGVRNLLLPNIYNKDPITMSSSGILTYCFCDLIKKSLIISLHTYLRKIPIFFCFTQVLNKAFFLPLIGTGEEIRSQYQQLAQVKKMKINI